MNILISFGDDLSLLSLGNEDFIKVGLPDPVSPFTRIPGGAPVVPVPSIWTCTAAELVKVNPASAIQDANGGTWMAIVGK